MKRVVEIVNELISILMKEVAQYQKNGIFNYQKVSSVLVQKSSLIWVAGQLAEKRRESEMRLKLTPEFRAKLIALAVQLALDLSSGGISFPIELAATLRALADELERQNSLLMDDLSDSTVIH